MQIIKINKTNDIKLTNDFIKKYDNLEIFV